MYFGQAIGEHAASGSGPDDDEVVDVIFFVGLLARPVAAARRKWHGGGGGWWRRGWVEFGGNGGVVDEDGPVGGACGRVIEHGQHRLVEQTLVAVQKMVGRTRPAGCRAFGESAVRVVRPMEGGRRHDPPHLVGAVEVVVDEILDVVEVVVVLRLGHDLRHVLLHLLGRRNRLVRVLAFGVSIVRRRRRRRCLLLLVLVFGWALAVGPTAAFFLVVVVVVDLNLDGGWRWGGEWRSGRGSRPALVQLLATVVGGALDVVAGGCESAGSGQLLDVLELVLERGKVLAEGVEAAADGTRLVAPGTHVGEQVEQQLNEHHGLGAAARNVGVGAAGVRDVLGSEFAGCHECGEWRVVSVTTATSSSHGWCRKSVDGGAAVGPATTQCPVQSTRARYSRYLLCVGADEKSGSVAESKYDYEGKGFGVRKIKSFIVLKSFSIATVTLVLENDCLLSYSLSPSLPPSLPPSKLTQS